MGLGSVQAVGRLPTNPYLMLPTLLLASALFAQPSAPTEDADTLLLAHFDEAFDADFAVGATEAEAMGATLSPEGKWGGCLDLREGGQVTFDAEGNLDMSGGTLMFWLKPEWDPASTDSHALLSMGLDGDPPGYFALSQGWWETGGGAGRLYFVYDNQAYMHVSTPQLMTLGEHPPEIRRDLACIIRGQQPEKLTHRPQTAASPSARRRCVSRP